MLLGACSATSLMPTYPLFAASVGARYSKRTLVSACYIIPLFIVQQSPPEAGESGKSNGGNIETVTVSCSWLPERPLCGLPGEETGGNRDPKRQDTIRESANDSYQRRPRDKGSDMIRYRIPSVVYRVGKLGWAANHLQDKRGPEAQIRSN